jgi:hypothetical protein
VSERPVLTTLKRHGTPWGYDKGCRCEACSSAKLAKRRAARARARAANAPAYQRELAASRARKERYRGTCRNCGATTTGCDGPGSAPELCYRCAPAVNNQKLRGKGPMQQRLLALLAEDGPLRFAEIRDRLGVSTNHASMFLTTNAKNGLIVRIRRGVYDLPGRT